MKSIIEFELLANGNLVDVTTTNNKIYQGAVATTEYHLIVKNDWRPTDLVWLAFTRPDGLVGQFRMTRKSDGWVVTTNGWETDVDIAQHNAILKVSFLMKRYSNLQVGKVVEEKTTETIDMVIHASAGYIPQNIEFDTAELLQEQINDLELDKVGRYDASNNGQNIPPHIVYAKNGLKSPNNLYYNFESQAIDENLNTITVKGGLLVFQNDNIQNEILLTDTGEIYERKIINNMVGDFRPSTMIIYDKIYTKTQADARFVKLFGNEAVNGIKTFIESPRVPQAVSDDSAINRQEMQGYTYDKAEVDARIKRLTKTYTFDTQQQFFDWLDGVYQRPDGVVKSDLKANNKIIIIEANVPNWLVAIDNPQTIADFKQIAEDIKALEEITTRPYKNIEATDGQEFVEELKDEIDLKSQIAFVELVEIKDTDWVAENDYYSFIYSNEKFVNHLTQKPVFEPKNPQYLAENKIFIHNTAKVFYDDGLKIKLIAEFEDEPLAVDLKFGLVQVTPNTLDGELITAEIVVFDNTGTQMSAVNVDEAIKELKGETDFIYGELQDLDNDKLDKKTTANTVYAVDNNGEQTNITFDKTASNNSIAMRDSAGRLQTKDAVNDDDAVNFKQLNSLGFGKLIFEKTVNVYSGASPLDFNDFITPLVLEPFKKYALKFSKVDMWEDPGKEATIILKGRTAEYATINMSNGSISKHGGGGSDTDIILRLTSYGGDISTPTVYLKTRIGSSSQLRYVWESENYNNMLKTIGSTPSDIDIETSISGIVGDGSYFILTLKIYELEV